MKTHNLIETPAPVLHTPGPWHASAAGLVTAPNQPRALAYVYHADFNAFVGGSADMAARETAANGYLIAAAPDLLAALQACAYELEEAADRPNARRYAAEQARAAIARAMGGA